MEANDLAPSFKIKEGFPCPGQSSSMGYIGWASRKQEAEMKKLLAALLFVCAFLTSAMVVLLGQGSETRQIKLEHKDKLHGEFAPGRILVKFQDDQNGLTMQVAQARIEYVHGLNRLKHFKFIDAYVYQTSTDILTVLKTLKQDPNVAYVEPDFLQKAAITIPNDSSFSQLWGMNNTGQTGGTIDADIDAPEAWDLTTGSSSVVVAVIDTGVDYNHSDLSANMWTNMGEIPGNGVDDDGNGYIDDFHGINAITGTGDPMDDNNHGTHCSGTIAGVGNNGIGVAGVCWTAKIMALKFLDSSGSGYNSDAIECIQYAINKGAHIMSNSWGGGGYSQALKDAIDAAGASGLLFCAAAGNFLGDNDSSPFYPASYSSPNIIAVAATDHNDNLSVWAPGYSGSNRGAYSVDVAAPGTAIYSTIPGNSYASFSGTSMATPHVSGLAALIKSYSFSLNWMQIKSRILGGADPVPALHGQILTGGRINAHNSLAMADITSYSQDIQSSPISGIAITVTPNDLDGHGSGSTDFTRRYEPYASVTLTAPATHLSYNFGYWSLEGSFYSDASTITLPVDFNHDLVAVYFVPLSEALDRTDMEVITGGTGGGWYGQVQTVYHGGDAAQSYAIPDSRSGYMQTWVYGPGTLSFYWKVSSEPGYDFLEFYVDGVPQNQISGEVDWQQVSSYVGPGIHVVQWIYQKDISLSYGSDCGWVDYLQFDGAPATLAQAVDGGVTSWTSGGNAAWFPQGTYYQYDGDAAQSADINDGEEAYLETTVVGPTPISFYWKVSSESGWDFLRFYIDNVLQTTISGEVEWEQLSYSLSPGAHVLRWTYSKDYSVSTGLDCGWVDHVVVSPAGTYMLSLTKDGVGGGGVAIGANPTPHYLPYQEVFESGEQLSILAVPDTGSRFTSWSGDLMTGDNPAAITMNQNMNITANFGQIASYGLSLTGAGTGFGKVKVAGDTTLRDLPYQQTFLEGTDVRLEAVPDAGSRFIGWSGDLAGSDNPTSVMMTMAKSIAVKFSRPEDLVGTWDVQGIYFRNSDTSEWVQLASPATQVACGDFNGDGIDDIVGRWPSLGGIWVRYSGPGLWAGLCFDAQWISCGDMNGDGFADLLGTWDGQGVFYRNSVTGGWVELGSPATKVDAGDLDGDGRDDLVGIWPSQGGIWVKYSLSGAWESLSSTATDFALGDINGDGRDDLVGTWAGQGVFYRDSTTRDWIKMATVASQVTCGDLDGDERADLIGIWPEQGGVWVKYSDSGNWALLSSSAIDITAGRVRASGEGITVFSPANLPLPHSGLALAPPASAEWKALFERGPHGRLFMPTVEKNLVPGQGLLVKGRARRLGPGEPGFICLEQKNLVPRKSQEGEKNNQKGESIPKMKKGL